MNRERGAFTEALATMSLGDASKVWCWKPVIAQIPFMNEPLFRAGPLHWWEFFLTIDSLKQDVPPPAPGEWFKIPKETPAMFKPEWYTGRDPKETA